MLAGALCVAADPLDAAERTKGPEFAKPVTIGRDCWIASGYVGGSSSGGWACSSSSNSSRRSKLSRQARSYGLTHS